MWIAEIFATSVLLFFLLLSYIKWLYKYWARRNLPYIEPQSIIWGNIQNPFNQNNGLAFDVKNIYDELKKRGHVHGGMYLMCSPIYVPVHPDMIKNILSKDFQYFVSHGTQYDEQRDPLSAHLFNLDGEKWRNMRVKLTPTFTSGKMKMMFETLLACSNPMINYIDSLCESNRNLDIKETLACYTTDIIGSCAFGVECNSFLDPNAEFRSYGRKILVQALTANFKRFLTFLFPLARKFIYVRTVNIDIEDFLTNVIKTILDYRQENNVKRNDFVQLLIEIEKNAKSSDQKSLTLQEMVAQAFIFFVAGFETSSTAMTFCLHELAFNQDIQDKLREEIRVTLKKHNGKLSYDSVMEMKYMDQVINETLRKYPPIPFINRVCTKTYKLPNVDVTIDEGMKVFISTLALHRDEDYYPNSEKFDPERFAEDNKVNRPSFTFLPFGEGPRICIGLRFGLMQTKTGISLLLNKFRILPTEDANYQIKYDSQSFILSSKNALKLKVEKLKL